VNVSIVMRVVFHGGRRVVGGLGGVVRLRLRGKAKGEAVEKKSTSDRRKVRDYHGPKWFTETI
jgi:hypothetical protein